MEFSKRSLVSGLAAVLGILLISIIGVTQTSAQSTYTAQLTGVVTDSSGGVIPNATVTLTDEGTNISTVRATDSKGVYALTNLRPSKYTIRVEAPGMNPLEHHGLVLAERADRSPEQPATVDWRVD